MRRLWAFWNQADQKGRHDSFAEHEICISIKQALAEPFPFRGTGGRLSLPQALARSFFQGTILVDLVVFILPATFTLSVLTGPPRRRRRLGRLEGQFRQAIIVFHTTPHVR